MPFSDQAKVYTADARHFIFMVFAADPEGLAVLY
jgi:hypothetical protein